MSIGCNKIIDEERKIVVFWMTQGKNARFPWPVCSSYGEQGTRYLEIISFIWTGFLIIKWETIAMPQMSLLIYEDFCSRSRHAEKEV